MRLQNTVEKQAETKSLLEENLKVSKATLKLMEKTRKYIFWSQVANWLKLIMIIAPIILAILYLPSLFEKWREEILGPLGSFGNVQQLQNAESLIEELKTIQNGN